MDEAGVFIVILTAGLFALYEGHYYFAAAFIVVGFAGVIAVTTHVKGKRLKLEHAAIGALILTWIFFGYDICDRNYFSPAVETDARLFPFAEAQCSLIHFL